jgi:hypothetical protein
MDHTNDVASGLVPPADHTTLALKAAAVRWFGDIRLATHGSEISPLRLDDIELPCYVLADATRVLARCGMLKGIGIAGGGGQRGVQRLIDLLQDITDKGLDCTRVAALIHRPIAFRPARGRAVAYGYAAGVLMETCCTILAARTLGLLAHNQLNVANRCGILVRGCERVGLDAMIDEATGFPPLGPS